MFQALLANIRRHSQHYKEMLYMYVERVSIMGFLPSEIETGLDLLLIHLLRSGILYKDVGV
jgi:hypothetical protein